MPDYDELFRDFCQRAGGQHPESCATGILLERVQCKMGQSRQGKAEKGGTVANLAVGALAQHYTVDFEILPTAEGGILRLHKGNTGLMGGLIGVEKVNLEFNQMSDTMVSWFAQQGLLINVKRN